MIVTDPSPRSSSQDNLFVPETAVLNPLFANPVRSQTFPLVTNKESVLDYMMITIDCITLKCVN